MSQSSARPLPEVASGSSDWPAQVAGAFYPAIAADIRTLVTEMATGVVPPAIDPKIVVVPHAGLRFCGRVAVSALLPLARRREPVRRVVIFGPAHRLGFDGLAIHPATRWLTPLGPLAVASDLAQRLPSARALPEAFVGEHALEVPLVVLQALMPTAVEILPVLVGNAAPDMVADALRQLWGGPETVIVISSDLSHFLTQPDAQRRDRATSARIEDLAGEGLTAADACGFRPLAAALRIAASHDMRVTTLALATSADAGGDPERVVGYGGWAFEYAARARLADADRRQILLAAMAGLQVAAASGGCMPELRSTAALSPVLATRKATFVTLLRDGRLRGCIGSTQPHRPLIGDAFVNAVKAGFGDPRFPPLAPGDLAGLHLSVSILSHRRPMAAGQEDDVIQALEPDRDGLILQDGGCSALFLPSVWASIPDARHFVRQLKNKAGLPIDGWSPTMRAFRFRTESFAADMVDVTPSMLGPLQVVPAAADSAI